MVSKQLRRHQTAGGEATGAEGNVSSSHEAVLEHQCGLNRLGEDEKTRRKKARRDSDSTGDDEENDEEGEREDLLECPTRYGNQLGDLPDSERVFPAPTSHVASLNRELKALETRYFRTRLNLEKATEKVSAAVRIVLNHSYDRYSSSLLILFPRMISFVGR